MNTAPLLPANWRQPFDHLVANATKFREITAFPTLFLAALNHDDNEALSRVLIAGLVAFEEAKKPETSKELRGLCNAITWLNNHLAVVLNARDEAKEKEAAEQKQAAEKPEQKQKPEEVQP